MVLLSQNLLGRPNEGGRRKAGRHWIGGERGGKGGAMRAYKKWFWHDSIFSCVANDQEG
jgi:hypothetical protein